MSEDDGKSRMTAMMDSDGNLVWVEDGLLCVLRGGMSIFDYVQLRPEMRAKLACLLLGVTAEEIHNMRRSRHWEVSPAVDSLLAKLKGKP